jgi:uncharacterized protein
MDIELVPAGHSFLSLMFVTLALCVAALTSGLSGFGFSAIGAAILLALPPAVAIPLLMTLSTATQLLAIHLLRTEMMPVGEWLRRWPGGPAPYVLGGLLGVPVGVHLLLMLHAGTLMACFGALLLVYAAHCLLKPHVPAFVPREGAKAPISVGFVGGAIGGFTAFPGAAVVVWMGLTGAAKSVARSVVQPYILTLQVYALATLAIVKPGTFDARFWHLLVLLLPAVLPYTWAGVSVYRSFSDLQARRLTVLLLGGSGAGLLLRSGLSLPLP